MSDINARRISETTARATTNNPRGTSGGGGNNTGLKYEAEGKEFWYQLCVLYEANRETKYEGRMAVFLDHQDSGPLVQNENKYRMKMSRYLKQYKAGKLTAGMGPKKRNRNRQYIDIEEALIRELQGHRGAVPKKKEMRKMAMRIAKTLGKKDSFKASHVWLENVLERMRSASPSTCPSELDHDGFSDLGGDHEGDIESASIPYLASPIPEFDVIESEWTSSLVTQETIERSNEECTYRSADYLEDSERVDHTSIEHEALHGGWFNPEETMREEPATDLRHPDGIFVDPPSISVPDRLQVNTVMTPDVPPPPPPPPAEKDEKNTFKRQYTAVLKTLKAGIVHSRFAAGEKMPSKLLLRTRSRSEKASGSLPGLFREGQGSLGESRSGDVQPFRDLLRDQNEVGYEPSPEEILPGAWRFDARETSEHLAPHPRLGHMLGFSSDLHSSSPQYQRQQQESGGFFDEEAYTAPIDATVKVSKKRQLPRWFLALLCALVLVAVAAIVVTLVVSHKSGSQLEGNYTIESAPSSSPSQDAPEWEQLGQVLRGEKVSDQLGRTLAISSGGSIVAASTRVFTPSNNTEHKDYVRVHQLNSYSQWVQLGDDFETADQTFVDLANNGTILLIATVGREDGSTRGSVKVFEWSATDGWNQLGDTIVADASEDSPSRYFGYESKMSEDGSVVVVCDAGTGDVKAYSMVAGSWAQVGQTLIAGKTTFPVERADGSTLSINDIGTVMAIGDYNNELKEPVVRVYTYQQGTRKWKQRGNVIERAMIDITSDWKNHILSVSLSSDGNSVAVGNRYSYSSKGMVQVLRYVEGDWVRRGAMVIGKEPYKEFGSSVSLSADGSMFAVGSFVAGKSAVYYLTEAKGWELVGETIDSSSGFAEASYVSLASDGMTIAIAGVRAQAREWTVTIFHLV